MKASEGMYCIYSVRRSVTLFWMETSGQLYINERSPDVHCTGGPVSLAVGLVWSLCAKRTCMSLQEIEARFVGRSVSSVVYYADYAILVPKLKFTLPNFDVRNG